MVGNAGYDLRLQGSARTQHCCCRYAASASAAAFAFAAVAVASLLQAKRVCGNVTVNNMRKPLPLPLLCVCVCVCRPIKCYVIVHFYVTVYVNRLCMLFICRNVHQYLMLGCPKGCLFVCVCVHVYQHLFTPQFVLICKLSETIFKRLYAAHSNSRAMKQ